MRDIAICVQNSNKGVNAFNTIDAIKKAGFEYVFIQWYNYNDWNPTQEEQLKYIRQKGLKIIFAHLGYQNINDLWLDNEGGSKIVDRYKEDIKRCSENNISMVIMHLTSKKNPPMYNELGLNRLKEIVDFAEKLNVQVAFENNKVEGYLEYVISNIKNKNVGICFDSGHCHAFFNDEFNFSMFKDKIIAVHLHDNDKSDDLHLIPFDGTINWDKFTNDLIENGYNGPVTLETCYRYDYLKENIDDFYKQCYEVGKKIEQMMRRDV